MFNVQKLLFIKKISILFDYKIVNFICFKLNIINNK